MTNIAYLPLVELSPEEHSAAEFGTLITASDRARREFSYAFDHAQMLSGATAWPAPAIAGFDSQLRMSYENARAESADLPVLLSPIEQHALFRTAAPEGLAHLTPQFEDAWGQVHSWELDPTSTRFEATENSRAYAIWHTQAKQQLQMINAITAAELPSHAPAPAATVMHLTGFDVLTKAQKRWITMAREHGCTITQENPTANASQAATGQRRSAKRYASKVTELTSAIQWALAQLEAAPKDQPLPRIAIVVPDLLQQRARVSRLLRSHLDGGLNTPQGLYNLSGGQPLSQNPLVESALLLLSSVGSAVHYSTMQALLADPALPGITASNRLAPQCNEFLRLGDLPADAGPEGLRSIIRSVKRWGSETRALADWWSEAAQLLRTARWHTARTDSEGFQATNALLELLITQAPEQSDRIAWSEAFELLASVAQQTLFAPAGAPAPIQVLGYLEALGLEFDHLWICGMDASSWPTPVALNPLLPPTDLEQAGMPRSSYERELEFAVSWLARVTAYPKDCHASFVIEDLAEHEFESELEGISPLLSHWPHGDPLPPDSQPAPQTASASSQAAPDEAANEAVAWPEFHPALSQWRGINVDLLARQDTHGTPPVGNRLKGATRRLQNQAECPMRGWSMHTLALEEPEPPHSLPNPKERGILLHSALQQLSIELPDSQTLEAQSEAEIRLLCNTIAVAQVDASFHRYPQPVRSLEVERTSLALQRFIDLERKRGEYFVNATELEIAGRIGRWEINLKIDRVDDVPDGQVVIDYKSRAPSKNQLLDDRLRAPQIPLYTLFLLAGNQAIDDIDLSDLLVKAGAFAEVRPEGAKYTGLRDAEHETGMPPKLDYKTNWSDTVHNWQARLVSLTQEIEQGLAVASPAPRACDTCTLQALCRYPLNND